MINRDELMAGVKRYIGHISKMVAASEEYLCEGEKCTREAVGEDGEVIYLRQWFSPPTVSGLCLEIGVSVGEWESFRYDSELGAVVDYMETVIRAYCENELATRQKNISGIIWQLEHSPLPSRADGSGELTMQERYEILRELGVKGVSESELSEGE
jgi:hypothetical protein